MVSNQKKNNIDGLIGDAWSIIDEIKNAINTLQTENGDANLNNKLTLDESETNGKISSSNYSSIAFSSPDYSSESLPSSHYSSGRENYVDLQNYREQQREQIFDLSRNGESKKVLVHHSAGDMGAWAYTTLTDRTIVLDPSLLRADMGFRRHVMQHEQRHRNGEYETESVIANTNKSLQDKYPNVRFGV